MQTCTFILKSDEFLIGSWKGLRLCLPALNEETLSVSKNLSILSTKYAVSNASQSPEKYKAWDTDALKTYSAK